jgi:protein ImuB
MKARATSRLQHSLWQPAEPQARKLSPAPAPSPEPASLRQEWWAAVQLPLHEQEVALLETVARSAQAFTPRVSLAPPDAVLLELRGCVRLFGGVQELIEAVSAAFPSPYRLAFAPTPLAAQVFARCNVPARLMASTRLVGDLSPLPLIALRWPDDILRRLAAVGVRTIGAALRLPRAGFARRFGPATLNSLDRLLGRQGDPRHAYAAPERFRRRCDPEVELTEQAGVLTLLAPLCGELEAFLRTRQRGITSLAVQLTHRQHAPTRHVLRLAVPAQRAEQILRLLELEFGRVELPAPVRRCELRSGPLVDIAVGSETLWHPGEQGGGAATTQMPSFLEQLRARLGAEAITGLELVAGHRPERLSLNTGSLLSPVTGARAAQSLTQSVPWKAARRPLWLLQSPVALAAHEGWPWREGQRLQLIAGPERVESGWWDGGDVERDYYQALDAAGARLWVFRERGAQSAWFLHGFFG